MTKHAMSLFAGLVLVLAAGGAQAACYADYKAKRDNPLRLHYGVVEISESACKAKGRARAEVAEKLEDNGWKLLTVVSLFGEDGLEGRKKSAGEYYLRF